MMAFMFQDSMGSQNEAPTVHIRVSHVTRLDEPTELVEQVMHVRDGNFPRLHGLVEFTMQTVHVRDNTCVPFITAHCQIQVLVRRSVFAEEMLNRVHCIGCVSSTAPGIATRHVRVGASSLTVCRSG